MLQIVAASHEPPPARSSVLVEAFRAAFPGTWQQRKALVKQLKHHDLKDPAHQWGETAMGGGLGLLALAADLGSPALVRRCLQAECPVEARVLTIAWRTAQPKIVLLLEDAIGCWRRPWRDAELEQRVEIERAEQLRRQLDRETDQGSGGRTRAGRL